LVFSQCIRAVPAGKIGASLSEANTGNTNMSKLLAYTDGYKTLGIYA
jgi:POT family proton-dependent oligopeptide transporter